MDLTSSVAADQLAAGAFFPVKMGTHGSDKPCQLAPDRRPRWCGWFQTQLGPDGRGGGYHVDPAQTIENGRGGILVTHRGWGHKVR